MTARLAQAVDNWSAATVIRLASVLVALVVWLLVMPDWGSDAIAYWLPDPIGRYAVTPELAGYGVFRYTPVAALAANVFSVVPWPVFLGLWTAALVVCVAWLVGPRNLGIAMALPPVAAAVALGNVTVISTVVLVVGLRYPVAWLWPMFTKLSPLGIVWFAVKRDWRALGIIAAVGVPLVLLSAILLPGSWQAWWAYIRGQAGEAVPLFPLTAVASCLLVAWGAWRNRPIVLPIAFLLWFGTWGLSSFVILLAVPRLLLPAGAVELDVGHHTRAFGLRGAARLAAGERRPLEGQKG